MPASGLCSGMIWRADMQTIIDATIAAVILIPGLCYLWG